MLPVGDPPNGGITIDIARFGDGCVRRYVVGPGVELDAAVDFARQWVTVLGATAPPVAAIPAAMRPPSPIAAVRYSDNVSPWQVWQLAADGVLIQPSSTVGFDRAPTAYPLPDGSTVHLADDDDADGRCGGHAVIVTRGGVDSPPDGDLPLARSLAVTPGGIVLADRDVCPDGALWGDPGTHWELVRLDLSLPDPQVEVLLSRGSDPSQIVFHSPEGNFALGFSTVSRVTDDGRFLSMSTYYNVEQGNYQILRLDPGAGAVEIAVPSACVAPDDIIGPPTFLDGARAVIGRRCGNETRIETVDLDAGSVIDSTSIGDAISGYSHSLDVDVLQTGGGIWVIATWNRDVEAPSESVLVHAGQVAVLTRPGFDGFAFSLDELIGRY